MNKYIIKQDNTGIRVGNFVTSTSNGKIILNGVEITDIDTFNKAVDTFKDLQNEIEEKDKEIERLNNIIYVVANDILKELNENKHLSYGVALSIRQKLLNYQELKEGK